MINVGIGNLRRISPANIVYSSKCTKNKFARAHQISRIAHTPGHRAGNQTSQGVISCPVLNQGWGGKLILSILHYLEVVVAVFRLGGTAAGLSEFRDPVAAEGADVRRRPQHSDWCPSTF